MVVGCGVDLLEHGRMRRELSRGPWQSPDGVFTPLEIQAANAGAQPSISLAACFALKEATLKALGVEITDFAFWAEVEVRAAPGGTCEVVLHGRARQWAERLGVRKVWSSTTRTSRRVAAFVILET